MAGFAFNPNFNFNDIDPNVLGEEATSANQGTTSQVQEGAAGDASVANPSNPDNDPFMGLGALITNDNFNLSLPIHVDNDPFMPSGALTTNDNSNSEQGQSLGQQVFQEGISFDSTNVSNAEEDDWLKLTSEEEDEAFHRLMEMSPEEFDKMMREFPDDGSTALGPSSTTPYAISNKRVRCNEMDSAQTLGGGAPSTPQPAIQPQQMHQIRQIREAKSRQGAAIEGLRKKIQDLEAVLAKAQLEAKDAFENGRMVALLGVEGDCDSREAKLRHEAELEHERQIGAMRNFLEEQISDKSRQLNQYRVEAGDYKTSVESEAERYKQAAEEEIAAQKAAVKAAEGAKNKAESNLSEQTKVLELAKLYVAKLEKKVADLDEEKANWEAAERLREQNSQPPVIGALEDRIKELEAAAERTIATLEESAKAIEMLNGANERAENAHADMERLYKNSQFYATELEIQLANLEKEQSSMEATRLQQEKERKTLEEKVKDLESTAEKAKKGKEETQSVVGPVEQDNIEPSTPASAKTLSIASSLTFAAAKEFPLRTEKKPVHDKESQRQSVPQPQFQPWVKKEREPAPEPEPPLPSQWGMFSSHYYPPIPANRPRRIHIHAEEAIRNRLRIPLSKVHSITSKLDKIDDAKDGAGVADKAGLIIAAELTGLSIRDLRVIRSLRMDFPGISPRTSSVITSAQLEIPKTLVDLLASEDRPAIRAFLDGASFPQLHASSDIAQDTRSQGTQTKALDTEVDEFEKYIAIQEEGAVVQSSPKQSRWGLRFGAPCHWKTLSFLFLLALMLPLLLPLPWSSPVTWFFEDPDTNSRWLNYVPPPSPWSRFIPDFSGWPEISKFFGRIFEDVDLESKWCGNIPIG